MSYIYLYGQVMATESFLLEGEYPKADGYAAIARRHFHVGGETGTAAAILASLGEQLKIGGTHIGSRNRDLIRSYFTDKNVDISELKESDFEGAVDYMIIAGDTRTGLGEWSKYYARKERWYELASEASIRDCSVCALDPFWEAEGPLLCNQYHKQYVTIDSTYDSVFTKYCEVIAISHEFLDGTYPGIPYEELMVTYTKHTDGLVIFTMGGNPLLYARKGHEIQYFTPYRVTIESTLGAGDSFKAGCVYALAKHLPDDDIVKTASAVAAAACMHFPIADTPPTLELIQSIMNSNESH